MIAVVNVGELVSHLHVDRRERRESLKQNRPPQDAHHAANHAYKLFGEALPSNFSVEVFFGNFYLQLSPLLILISVCQQHRGELPQASKQTCTQAQLGVKLARLTGKCYAVKPVRLANLV